MLIPESLYREQDRFRYPAQFISRRVTVIGGAVTTVQATVWEGFQDRHLVLNTLWVNWVVTPNAVTQTRMAELNAQLIDINGAVLTFCGLRNNPGALSADNAQTSLDFAGGSPQASAAFANIVPAGTWLPAGNALRIEAIVRNATPIFNDIVVALTGFAIPLGEVVR